MTTKIASKATDYCRVIIDNEVTGERSVKYLPVTSKQAIKTCLELTYLTRFIDWQTCLSRVRREERLVDACLQRSAGEVYVRIYPTSDDLETARAVVRDVLAGTWEPAI